MESVQVVLAQHSLLVLHITKTTVRVTRITPPIAELECNQIIQLFTHFIYAPHYHYSCEC